MPVHFVAIQKPKQATWRLRSADWACGTCSTLGGAVPLPWVLSTGIKSTRANPEDRRVQHDSSEHIPLYRRQFKENNRADVDASQAVTIGWADRVIQRQNAANMGVLAKMKAKDPLHAIYELPLS